MFKFCIIFITRENEFISIIFFSYFEKPEREISNCWFKPYKASVYTDLKLTFKQGQQRILVIFGKKSIVITLMLEIMNKESSKFFSKVAHVTVVTEVFNHLLWLKSSAFSVSSNFQFREPRLKIMKTLLQMATRQAIKQLFYLIGLRLSDLLRFIFLTCPSSYTRTA